MNKEVKQMWANKLGLDQYDEIIVKELINLMVISKADYTILFRKLSEIPNNLASLRDCFYSTINNELNNRWDVWLKNWQSILKKNSTFKAKSTSMKSINPIYTWREWMVVHAYEQAEKGNYSTIKELQAVFSDPYTEQVSEIDQKYNRLKPKEYFNF